MVYKGKLRRGAVSQPKELRVWGEDLPASVQHEIIEDDGLHTIRFTRDGIALIVGCGHTTPHPGAQDLWATVYSIEAIENRANGVRVRNLLHTVQSHYKKHGYDFAVSCAETPWQNFHITMSGVPVRETCSGVVIDRRKQEVCESA